MSRRHVWPSGRPLDQLHPGREVSMVIQKRLVMLVSYVHYMYITNRTLDYNTADLDVLQSVSTWMDQLGDDPDEENTFS